ncbi:uncharacterized protein FMAN_00425 [Fusarium mangiferae]|uniref:Uncharacterized protein n=1 Tax=Fusarium mangiferae TaxID=192010 RepID=A0A1L7U418_FUSMA|nr:uncharacterized protein FMAN_00425 [Fusarium mangiferae]CVL03093.1 uncharacterized protein FMAN_00425 [Fusarium mangiferae]
MSGLLSALLLTIHSPVRSQPNVNLSLSYLPNSSSSTIHRQLDSLSLFELCSRATTLPLSYPPWAPGSKIPESDPQPTRVLVLTLPFLLPDAIHFNFT